MRASSPARPLADAVRPPDAAPPPSTSALEAELFARLREERAVAWISRRAVDAEDGNALVDDAAGAVAHALGCDVVGFFGREAAGVRFLAGTGWLETPGLVARADAGVIAGTAEIGASTVVGPASGDALLAREGIAAAACVGASSRHRATGVLVAGFRRPARIDSAQVEFLETVANVLGAALHQLETERRLRDRERLFAAVFDGAVDGMVLLDGGGRYLEVNRAAAALFGAAPSEVIGRTLEDVVPPPLLAELPDVRAPGARGADRGQLRVPLPDGTERYLEHALVRDILPDVHLALLRDVTERERARARIAIAERLISIGTLAAGVSHEINNPLAFCSSNLLFVLDELEALAARAGTAAPGAVEWHAFQAGALEALRDVGAGLDRMRRTVADMRSFAHGSRPTRGPVDVRAVVRSALLVTERRLVARAGVQIELAPVPCVEGSEGPLAQVVVNLLMNAADAIPPGDPASHRIRIAVGEHEDGRVSITVSDTGRGMPREVLSRAFDPFFTTKSPGEGTGFGLAIVQAIVAAQDGEVRLASTPGEGTTATVLLRTLREDPAAM